ncbi:MAG: ABC transporter substrate-binding protein, partial [Conexivisphaerales archaeon]
MPYRAAVTKIQVAIVAIIIIVAAAGGSAYYFSTLTKHAGKEILIGMPLPLNSPIGINMLDSAEMAAQQINSTGGVVINGTSYYIRIIPYDTQEADPSIPVSNGISAVTALITEDHVNFLVGGYRSDVVDAELPIAAGYHTIYITFGADPEISAFVSQNYSANKYIFNGFVNSIQQSQQTGPFSVYLLLAQEEGLIPLQVKNLAVLGEQAAWTKSFIGNGGSSSPLYTPLTQAGFNITTIDYFPLSPPGGSYDSLFTNLALKGTQAIFILAAGTESALFVKNWNSFNWASDTATGGKKPLLLGADVLAEMEGSTYSYWNATSGGCNGEITIGWGPMLPVNITPASIPFYNNFTKEFGFNPIFEDGFVYSAIYNLAQATEKAQSLDSNAVIPYLEQTDYSGPAGIIRYTNDHALNITLTPVPSIPAVAMQWQNDGRLHVVWTSLSPLTFTNLQMPNGQIENFTVKL